ncbi:UDP-N-acetyl-D-mannosaminuronic acid transferase RffM [Thermosynechococcus sp. NK55a]|nr:UDP-N-acetyl-D-mannosaminuronic acid transferase RffM [Thermosynechococcus sp. NK55a]
MGYPLVMPTIPAKVSVLGFPLHLVDNAPEWLLMQQRDGHGQHVITLNSEMVILAERTPEFADVLHRADLVIPDGSGVILYLRLHGLSVRRLPGIEFAEALLRLANDSPQPKRVFFYGAAPGVAEKVAERWHRELPNLKIVGVQSGYHDADMEAALIEKLKETQPHIILVALGVPRQEYWIDRHRHICPQAIWVGVGGSFDVWAGVKRRAPKLMQKLHLEWLYRLYQEPWRWRRMLALPQFAWKALLSRLHGRQRFSSR